jgi:hypothetical protein
MLLPLRHALTRLSAIVGGKIYMEVMRGVRDADHPGSRLLTRGDLTNRKVGTWFARDATNGSLSEGTLTDGKVS